MKATHLTVRWALGPALFLVLPFLAPDALSPQGARQSNDQPIFQNALQPQAENKATAEALAQATQLSLTVVKLYNEGKYDEALPLAKWLTVARQPCGEKSAL